MSEEQNIVEKILETCDNSTTELARRLTEHTQKYYVPQLVNHWKKVGRIPPEHIVAVSQVTGVSVEEIAPELFKEYHRARGA